MDDHPLLILLLIAGSAYLFKLWLHDYRLARKNTPNPRALPGAAPANRRIITLAIGGALILVAAETLSEIHLGTVGEQSTLTLLFAAYTLCAAFLEEIVFRGYIVVTKHGPLAKWTAAVGASLIFAIAHPYLWTWDNGLQFNLTSQPLISTISIFATSLWLYAMRFSKLNPLQSLIPCIAAHLARNTVVILIKATQGHLVGLY